MDFGIFEPSPYNPGWYSFKINGPGIHYKVAINIQNGWIVWVNGPYPAGAYSDSRTAVDCSLLDNLQPGETVIVDWGYKGHGEVFKWPTGQQNALEKMKSQSRAWHESLTSSIWAEFSSPVKTTSNCMHHVDLVSNPHRNWESNSANFFGQLATKTFSK